MFIMRKTFKLFLTTGRRVGFFENQGELAAVVVMLAQKPAKRNKIENKEDKIFPNSTVLRYLTKVTKISS